MPKGDVTEYRLEKHVSDMLALLAHLQRDKAVWVGHDWGAGLVWAFAAQHPEKCVGVSCVSVPYRVLEGGIDLLVSLSNRDIYPEDQYPLAQCTCWTSCHFLPWPKFTPSGCPCFSFWPVKIANADPE